jgi:cytochrome c553
MTSPHAILLLVIVAVSAPVSAQEPGAALAQRLCASCHGQSGLPADRTVPVISGQQSAYLQKQLRDYRSGDRDSEIMSSISQSLGDRQIVDIADHFGAAPWPRGSTSPSPPAMPAAVAACEACHNRELKGANGPAGWAPRLAGQSLPYLVQTMTAFSSGERANNPQMSALMKSLAPADRQSIADYLARLP